MTEHTLNLEHPFIFRETAIASASDKRFSMGITIQPSQSITFFFENVHIVYRTMKKAPLRKINTTVLYTSVNQ